ncbi:MAG: site-specific integrase [Bacteroidales bacterium]
MNKISLYANKRQPKSDNTYSVYVATVICGKPIRFSTGVSAAWEEIDFNRNILRGRTSSIKDANLIISNCIARISDIFVRYRLTFLDLTPDLLRREYDNYTQNFLFYDYAVAKLNARRHDISNGTYRRHFYQLQKIKQFSKNAYIADITEDFLTRLKRWCKSERRNSPSGISNTFKVAKFYYARAIKEGLAKANPFTEVKTRCTIPNREFATKEELVALITLYRSRKLHESLQNVLRYFLFSCLTGLRFSDVQAFSHSNIVGRTIVLQMQKTKNETGKVVKIPLTKGVEELINDANARLGEKIFRVISNQKTNAFLKDIISLAGLQKKLTFHCGRHTFATNFLHQNGEKLATLQELLGHAKIEQTLVYAHVLYGDMEKSLEYLNDIW